jgi:hypothetical protein
MINEYVVVTINKKKRFFSSKSFARTLDLLFLRPSSLNPGGMGEWLKPPVC